ncbi:MAG: tetratricopeptide repeat protein [Acidobacteria bacterium]|nr:tetratricopeptide repeat protein [Acidobacteriota bacterium]
MNSPSHRTESLDRLREERLEIERELQDSEHDLTTAESDEALARHRRLRKGLLHLIATSDEESIRIDSVVEVVRSLENELIYLHNFLVAPEDQDAKLARRLEALLQEIAGTFATSISRLEIRYYLGVLSLYGGKLDEARASFEEVCESEESDESNDIKYKSFVMLGHLSHVQEDYERARDLHDQSMQYTHSPNVTAQAIALKALNSYALQKRDEALELFEKALELFRVDEPFYNEYFHRNSLLFCGAILFDREEHERAASYYEEVLDHVENSSYDYFDALVQLGKIRFASGDYQGAATILERAIEKQETENEYLLDTLYWLARAQLKIERKGDAKRCLEKVVASPVDYPKKTQAEQLLSQVS